MDPMFGRKACSITLNRSGRRVNKFLSFWSCTMPTTWESLGHMSGWSQGGVPGRGFEPFLVLGMFEEIHGVDDQELLSTRHDED